MRRRGWCISRHWYYCWSIYFLVVAVHLIFSMDVRLEVFEQTLVALVGDIVMGNINVFVVCPVIIPLDFSQQWYCSM